MIESNVAVKLTPAKNQLAKTASNVHKFGGSSLATPACIERVIDIIRQHCQLNDVVVVSANGNTTDALFSLYQLGVEYVVAQQENSTQINDNELVKSLPQQLELALTELQTLQGDLLKSLLSVDSTAKLTSMLSADIAQIAKQLTTDPEAFQNDLLAFGEVWSARLLAAVLSERVCPSYMLDARDFLLLESEKKLRY